MKNVTFLLTNRCNLRCRHCFSNSGCSLERELGKEDKVRVIEKLIKLGTKRLVFSGGEPFLDKDLGFYIKLANIVGKLKTSLLTNGVLLDREKLRSLIHSGLDELAISIYSEDITGFTIGQHKRYLEKIERAINIVEESTLPYKITIPVSGENANFTIAACKHFAQSKFTPVRIRLFIVTPAGRARSNFGHYISHNQWMAILEKIKKVIGKFGGLDIRYECNYTRNNSFYKGCQIREFTRVVNNYADPHVDANGDLYLCGLLVRQKQLKVGNVLEPLECIREKIKAFARCKINNSGGIDICPVLSRANIEKLRPVCPIIYERNSL